MVQESELSPVPSVSEVRRRLLDQGPRIGTGWPVLDEVTGGLPLSRSTIVRGPQDVRLQLLARLAAWTAGEGLPTLIASRSVTAEELWLAVAGGGLGLPPRALLETTTHDAWLDARLRVLDLRVIGGAMAPMETHRAVHERVPRVLIIDDYVQSDEEWDQALSERTGERVIDLQVAPRTLGCALILGMGSMDYFSDLMDRAALTVRLVPDDDYSRIRVSAYEGLSKEHRKVLLRDGFLEAPLPGRALIRRPGVTNIWLERTEEDIAAFAGALGAEVTEMVWEEGDGDEAT
ncbi:hypothetical protein MWU75_10210 [Ornithinimicrobium sp. F0845]|uniref:hypothetical protein n=1 Tax=Ornithinimicrobium sp. F0845 TaxID=2926412 RepID=UPI001FF6A79B|nr:hypothetical protein [Ornithinimicrobium sp. F0845]MCK0112511.1 hypothetical protein [Ornithinimicrobium sp. F0845]